MIPVYFIKKILKKRVSIETVSQNDPLLSHRETTQTREQGNKEKREFNLNLQ